MSPVWSNLLSGLIGTLIGGLMSCVSAWWVWRLTRKHEVSRAAEITRNRLGAIHDELVATWERYNGQIGHRFETADPLSPPLMIMPIGEDYFPIYRNNTDAVAQISDAQARHLLPKTYICAVGMIDSLRFNNELVRHVEVAAAQAASAPTEANSNAYFSALNDCHEYWQRLCGHHTELEANVTATIDVLRRVTATTDIYI